MTDADLPHVGEIAEIVHPSFPEDVAIFVERLRLYPHGCHVLQDNTGALDGYVLSHPWTDAPPSLNSLLHRLPDAATTYYIHDVALLPAARGGGAGAAIVDQLIVHARHLGLTTASLVAVNGSELFWHKQGFCDRTDGRMREKLKSYGAEAMYMRVRLSL